jgi:AcrR family transcriptional regulator
MTPRPPITDDDVRRALQHAAHELLATEGPDALTVRQLATRAGVSTMNIYSRFGGKDGIVEDLYIAGFHMLGAAMASAGTTDDPLADLHACGRAYRRFALEHPTYYAVMFDRAVPGYDPTPSALAEAAATLHQLAERLARCMTAGILRDEEPLAVAASVWATCHGLVSLELRGIAPGGIDWSTTYGRTLDALIRGLA